MRFNRLLKSLTVLLGCLTILSSCGEKPSPEPTPTPTPTPDPTITLGSASAVHESEAGKATVSITIENPVSGTNAEAVTKDSWLKVESVSNTSFSYSYEANTAADERSGSITVSYGKASAKTYSVKQKGYVAPDPVFTVPQTEFKVGSTSGKTVIEYSVENPVEGVAVKAATEAAWLKLEEPAASSVTFAYEDNESPDERSAEIVLSYGDLTPVTVTVTQDGQAIPDSYIVLTAKELEVDATAGNGKLAYLIGEQVSWISAEASCDAEWVKLSNVCESSLDYSYEANELESPRSATITVSYGKAEPAVFVLKQAAYIPPTPVIKLDETSVELDCDDNIISFYYTIENPVKGESVKVDYDNSWIYVQSATDTKLTFMAYKNDSYDERRTVITLSYGKAEPVEFTVIQQGQERPAPSLYVPNPMYQVGPSAGSIEVEYTIINPVEGVALEATPSESWLSIGEISDTKIVINYEKTYSIMSRDGKVVLTYAGASEPAYITIYQDGKPTINLWSSQTTVEANAGNRTLTYSVLQAAKGDKVEASSDAEWLKIGEVTNSSLDYSFSGNTTTSERTAHITLTCGAADPKDYTVTQKGLDKLVPVIVLEESAIEVGAAAGSYDIKFSIANPIEGEKVKVYRNDGWLAVGDITDDSVSITYEANTWGEERSARLTIGYKDASYVYFKITQKATGASDAEIVLESDTKSVDGQEGVGKIYYSIKNPLDGVSVVAKSTESWLRVENTTKQYVSYVYDENSTGKSRTGYIDLYYGDYACASFCLVQDTKASTKPVIVPSSTSLTYDGLAGSYELPVSITNPTSGVILKATCSASWLTIKSASNSAVKFDIAKNTGDARSTRIQLSYTGAETVYVDVLQEKAEAGVVFRIEKSSYNMQKSGARITVNYTVENCSDYSLSFSYSQTWLHGGSYSTSAKTIYFNGDENNTGSSRQCTVTATLKSGDQTKEQKFTVIQTGEDGIMVVDPDVVNVGVKGGTFSFDIKPSVESDDVPTVSKSESWITYLNLESKYHAVFKVSENKNSSSRTAYITVKLTDHKDAVVKIVQAGADIPEGAVDLGLPSGLLWASANVGASSPSQVGDYYAWGETSTKSSFSWDNYAWGTKDKINRYSTSGATTLQAIDDAATSKLGSYWRMPSSAEVIELQENCSITVTSLNGVSGVEFKSNKNGATIFIPYTGHMDGNSKKNGKDRIMLWSRSRSRNDANEAIYWDAEGCFENERYLGMPIRAVYVPQ